MADIATLCSQLEKWLTAHFPAALGSFNPGASKEQIAAHERATGFTLPEDVRQWFRWRNGQKRWCKQSVFFGDESLSLEQSAEEWKDWQEDFIVAMNEEVAPACTSKPESAIVAAYSLPGWIPGSTHQRIFRHPNSFSKKQEFQSEPSLAS